MLKRIPPGAVEKCLTDAARSPMAAPGLSYPDWYVHRWHFLPEGYLSRRSVVAYDAVIRNVYNVASERRGIAAMVRHIRAFRPASVLDLGCGPGRYLAALRRALPTARLAGLDLSPFMLELARDRLGARGGVTLTHAAARSAPFADGSFGAVTASHLFGHLPADEAAITYAEAGRLLAPGGLLFVVDHSWHPRRARGFRLLAQERLLGGLQRLEVLAPA